MSRWDTTEVGIEAVRTRLRLRDSRAGDAGLLFDWRCDPVVVRQSLHRSSPDWSTHLRWLDEQLSDKNRWLLIVEQDGQAIGQVRFDILGEIATLSYSVSAAHRAQGHARTALILALHRLEVERCDIRAVRAQVRGGNVVSLKLLERLHFSRTPATTEIDRLPDDRSIVTLERACQRHRGTTA